MYTANHAHAAKKSKNGPATIPIKPKTTVSARNAKNVVNLFNGCVERKKQMPWIRKSDHERFFADPAKSPIEWKGKDKGWREKETGKKLMQVSIGRSIWMRPFMGGSGEVRRIQHLYIEGEPCPTDSTTYGASIYEDEIMEAGRT